jgi:glutathione S-transferase
MKLYDSIGPNPHVVRMFAAEKGIDLPRVAVDLMRGENRREPYMARNAAGTTPTLELDDGRCIGEIVAICEYLEERHPEPALIGATAEERAETRMWTRRIDLGIVEPMTNGFRASEGRRLFEGRMRLVSPDAAQELKDIAHDRLMWLDRQLDGRRFVCGDRFSLADILLYCFRAFGEQVGQPIPPEATWVSDWFGRVRARPSASV